MPYVGAEGAPSRKIQMLETEKKWGRRQKPRRISMIGNGDIKSGGFRAKLDRIAACPPVHVKNYILNLQVPIWDL